MVEEKCPFDKYGRLLPEPRLVPRTAADCIIVRKGEKCDKEILLITRKKKGPSQGKHAFPGGHIDYNEDP